MNTKLNILILTTALSFSGAASANHDLVKDAAIGGGVGGAGHGLQCADFRQNAKTVSQLHRGG